LAGTREEGESQASLLLVNQKKLKTTGGEKRALAFVEEKKKRMFPGPASRFRNLLSGGEGRENRCKKEFGTKEIRVRNTDTPEIQSSVRTAKRKKGRRDDAFELMGKKEEQKNNPAAKLAGLVWGGKKKREESILEP